MSKRTFQTVMGIILIGAFFLPYFKVESVNYSGLDLVLQKGSNIRFVFLAIPISGIALLLDASSPGSYSRGFFHWLPMLAILAFLFWADSQFNTGINHRNRDLGTMITDSIKGSTYGYWITLGAAFLVLLIEPAPNK